MYIDKVGFKKIQTVTAIIYTTTTHHPPTTHINFTLLFLSPLWSDWSMLGHFLIVLNLKNPLYLWFYCIEVLGGKIYLHLHKGILRLNSNFH